jgi:hypothetical protein
MTMDVKPYTALVGCPVVVEKFSTGRAKKARYASELPSTRRRRGICSPEAAVARAELTGERFVVADSERPDPELADAVVAGTQRV